MVKTLFNLILLIAVGVGYGGSGGKPYTVEDFSFPVKGDSLVLSGTLTIPASFRPTDKVAILVSPPQAFSRDYGEVYKSLADALTISGVAVLRFDNRAFVDTTLRYEKSTMFIQKDDALRAFDAVKSDHRFALSAVGLVGHSEGGSAAAIAVSERQDISFVVLLSTTGIKGKDLAFEQAKRKIEDTFHILPKADSAAVFDGLRTSLSLIYDYDDPDSLKYRMDNYVRARYELDPKLYGNQTVEEAVVTNRAMWLKPRLIAYVRFEPARYYSKIKCPALVMCGKMDDQLDCQSNLEGIKKIFKDIGKRNYEIVVLDDLGHSFQESDGMVKRPRYDASENNKPSKKAWAVITDWVGKI
ncbi:MAG TPA: alpha/beta fold hydrolase [Parapedobacter sp.]|uniref:alpha/beta fold hydrolase n=1 Tax=Parapedobacter sp. TaxID=1958893 RepID=UPI002C4A2B47|nr:alpha/beta fold hydrolase [Parapedobacter sp.]HWK58193.1 alpha/beta fold hydrolase [Parapedobacter sp.]